MATHSPIMVTPDFVDKTVRIEKRVDRAYPKPFTKRFGPIDPIAPLQRQLLPLFALQRSSRFLFSRGVLLVRELTGLSSGLLKRPTDAGKGSGGSFMMKEQKAVFHSARVQQKRKINSRP